MDRVQTDVHVRTASLPARQLQLDRFHRSLALPRLVRTAIPRRASRRSSRAILQRIDGSVARGAAPERLPALRVDLQRDVRQHVDAGSSLLHDRL